MKNMVKSDAMPDYEPTLDLRSYKFPPLDLLQAHGNDRIIQDPAELENNKNQIISTLKNYDIDIHKISATVGPTVTLYEIVPAPGVRISRIKNLEDDIALNLVCPGYSNYRSDSGQRNHRNRSSQCEENYCEYAHFAGFR